jgi:hypothetical protein
MFYAERYRPAMMLAGATRAQSRGVNDSRIGSDGLFGEFLFISIPPVSL